MYSTKAGLLFGIIRSGIKVKSYKKLPCERHRGWLIKKIYKLSYAPFATDSSIELKKTANDEIPLTPLTPEMEEICNGDQEIAKKIRLILMEYEMEKLTNNRVPSVINPNQMKELLELKGFMARRKKYRYYFLKELLPKIDKEKKEMKRLKKLEELKMRDEQEDSDHLQYGLNKNTILLYIRDQSVSRYYALRQSYALMFGQSLVFDLGFKNEMNPRELTNMVDQLQLAYSLNKIDKDPFNLHFTNVDPVSHGKLKLAMPQIEDASNMITITDKSYTELFPKKQLIYLSPDAPKVLKSYDPDTVYIIGGIVDLGNEAKLTMSKAKREGIAMAKLPLEDHLM